MLIPNVAHEFTYIPINSYEKCLHSYLEYFQNSMSKLLESFWKFSPFATLLIKSNSSYWTGKKTSNAFKKSSHILKCSRLDGFR